MTDEITLDAPETRLERFLAAAAGVEGITLDEPETRIEKYLYKIAQGGGGSGGGVLVVTDTDGTLDKTWQEIHDAMLSGGAAISYDENSVASVYSVGVGLDSKYYVTTVADDTYLSSTSNGYPALE